MARIAAVFEMQANSASVRQVYAAGDHLFHQGDTDRGIHKIVSGTVTVYRVTADGHRQIEAFAGPGDYVSLCLCATSPTSAEALSRVETEYVTRAAFERRLLEDAQFRQEVFRDIDKSAADARRQATLLACRCAKERVAEFVLFLDSHFAPREDGYTPICMSRCDMADHLGLTLETVSRMLNRFKQTNVIDLPRPDRFRILNYNCLSRLAGRSDQGSFDRNGIAV
ncbi:Crp/Fnr family transcriptional regulator [uncultured Hyphomonas sp.]|jgi:CRP-like cAMP-binding protein|uniref:Crp/Fnr family transcriptional regulator n=1 Tax=uncultured Hyphomonas sp. TaxID=225298 RepID=UPI000C3DFD8D|nr:hypothetical protein [Hyphomonadaceae bacterium]|tara:strand:- start:12340 stop:13014 length:675 start_codon:yes stop_codon:yes gene_type:complete